MAAEARSSQPPHPRAAADPRLRRGAASAGRPAALHHLLPPARGEHRPDRRLPFISPRLRSHALCRAMARAAARRAPGIGRREDKQPFVDASRSQDGWILHGNAQAPGMRMTRPLPPIQSLGGNRLLFIMAASPEYGPELKRRFEPLFTGVGPVEAATATAAALATLVSQEALPDLVVCLGSAGSSKLEQGEIYQASHVSYRDIDASALGFPKGTTPFLDLPAKIELPYRIPGVRSAS